MHPPASAPRQLPRIVASSPGTRARLAGERLERADESSLSSETFRTCHLREDVKVLWGERESLPSLQQGPAITVESGVTHPSDVMTPILIAVPPAMSPTPITTTTRKLNAAPPPYMTDRSSDPPISLNRHYANLLQAQEGVQGVVEILGPGAEEYDSRTGRGMGERQSHGDPDASGGTRGANTGRRHSGRNVDPSMDYLAMTRNSSYERPLTPHVHSRDGVEHTWANIEYARLLPSLASSQSP
jgi:hypothetical protein